jgi:hypothetical protein
MMGREGTGKMTISKGCAVAWIAAMAFVGMTDFIVVMPRIREQVGVSLSTMATQAQASLTRRLLERALESREPALRKPFANVSASRLDPG